MKWCHSTCSTIKWIWSKLTKHSIHLVRTATAQRPSVKHSDSAVFTADTQMVRHDGIQIYRRDRFTTVDQNILRCKWRKMRGYSPYNCTYVWLPYSYCMSYYNNTANGIPHTAVHMYDSHIVTSCYCKWNFNGNLKNHTFSPQTAWFIHVQCSIHSFIYRLYWYYAVVWFCTVDVIWITPDHIIHKKSHDS